MFVIEAYRTLRDRGPYPADQVLKDMDGSFGFVLFDAKAGTVFAALVSSASNPSTKHNVASRAQILTVFTFMETLTLIRC